MKCDTFISKFYAKQPKTKRKGLLLKPVCSVIDEHVSNGPACIPGKQQLYSTNH